MNNEQDDYNDMPELIDDYNDMPELIDDDYFYDIIINQNEDDYKDMPKLIDEDRIGFDTDYEDN